MMPKELVADVRVNRIFLDEDNPRHEPCGTQDEVIDYLCKHEYIYELAKDIAVHGINPLEVVAIIPLPNRSKRNKTYHVAEGNRRLCAIKLLNDPDLAPVKQRKQFERY